MVSLSPEEIFKPGFHFTTLNINHPITCKACSKPFSNIHLHLYNSQICKGSYSVEQLDTLETLAERKKSFKAADRQRTYAENHREKVSSANAAQYLKNQGKRFETGVGQAKIETLHKEDIEKFKVAREWIATLKVEDDYTNTKTMYTLKLINSHLRVNWKTDGDAIPLRISIKELQSPDITNLLKFLGLTPSKDIMIDFHSKSNKESCWTFPKEWDRCCYGNCKVLKCDSILEMKKRFLQEIIFTWNHTETDRGKDQWLDSIDCRGCKYSFKNLMIHLSQTKLDCSKHYSESEKRTIEIQIKRLPTLKDKREEAARKKREEKQMTNDARARREEVMKTYRPKTDEVIHVDIPSYLIPFKGNTNEDISSDNKLGKMPIKMKNVRKYYIFSL